MATAATPKKPRTKKAAPAAVAVAETFAAYKGFDKDLRCRGYQYEVGKGYIHTGRVVQCESGFHACQNPLDVLDYYGLGDGNRFARVALGGKVDRSDDKKWAAAEITIVAEIKLPDLIADAIKFIKGLCATDGDKVQSASGYSSQLAASGYYSQLAASGDYSKLAASGDYSKLEISGAKSAAAAVGPGSSIKAIDGTPIAICEYDRNGVPIGFATGIVGKDGIEAGKWYVARGGKLVVA